MTSEGTCDAPGDGAGCSRSKACKFFNVLSLAGLSLILVAAGFALRHVVRTLVILQAEEQAVMMAQVALDCEIREYMTRYYTANEPYLTIPAEDLPDDGSLVLVAENNGLDFESGSTGADGMGLKIMRYRAETMNSTLEIRSRESGGAVVTCVFPNKTADKKRE